ncbi:tautomerase family protein [Streptomyces sp. NBC_01727]|uniref:tautomerase family protein n=1 Tax=Streptomyces sp. NBC_01727 TaxID=2975924 RepID=UPI002E1200F5|nr:tautomerase family protein [Streptomyces sp. NBC_01727]
MPYYRFTISASGPSAARKKEIAEAVTNAHRRVTGAPTDYVNCSFTEVPPGSMFVSGAPVEAGRMMGVIRKGREESLKRRLITELAEAWSTACGERIDEIAIFLHEVPGYQCFEAGEILREAWEDPEAVLA